MKRELLLVGAALGWFASTARAQEPSQAPFDVADMTAERQLAVEIQIGPNGVSIVGAEIMEGAKQEPPVFKDLVVRISDMQRADVEILIADPRLRFDAKTHASQAIATVFVPFSPTLSTLVITPVPASSDFPGSRRSFVLKTAPFGGKDKAKVKPVSVREAVVSACQKRLDVPECRSVR